MADEAGGRGGRCVADGADGRGGQCVPERTGGRALTTRSNGRANERTGRKGRGRSGGRGQKGCR